MEHARQLKIQSVIDAAGDPQLRVYHADRLSNGHGIFLSLAPQRHPSSQRSFLGVPSASAVSFLLSAGESCSSYAYFQEICPALFQNPSPFRENRTSPLRSADDV